MQGKVATSMAMEVDGARYGRGGLGIQPCEQGELPRSLDEAFHPLQLIIPP